MLKFTSKQKRLIEMYSQMVTEGYDGAVTGVREKNVYNDFELRRFRHAVKPVLQKLEVKSTLDYGCGGSNWNNMKVFDGQSACEYFGIETAYYYEPARDIDERQKVDACFCFDVLEHVFIADISTVLRDIFSYATKLVVINVACYEANALLPNGENSHITVRDPLWWKGVLDTVCVEYPNISVLLFCSNTYKNVTQFNLFSARDWLESETFKVT